MSFSATRLTCYALIAAIEEDIRAALETALGDDPIEQVITSERVEKAQSRRKADGLGGATSVAGVLPYLDFADGYELSMSHKDRLSPDMVAGLRGIAPNLARVIAIRNRVAHTRPMEIDDSAHLLDVTETLTSSSGDWVTAAETLARLASDPSYVLGLTIRLPADPAPGPQHNLPIPDFDETGFFGRQEELRRIKRAIKGAYPVVSVLGDGGIGKTSIALKAAYELLEDPDQPFDALVWVTAKATILTPSEIRRINGAIESSLGLFAEAATQLGPGDTDDPVSEVLSYLEHFRVLLFLDNLETVLDQRLRDFLLELPIGSKVIITSRISLGIENPVHLQPLSTDDSSRLLRALSRVRNVAQLKKLPQDAVERLASGMGGHPAWIRWFVAGVQAGRRPEELITDNALLLDFCMSNVYEHLGDDARSVVACMQVLPGARNQAELAFLNEFVASRVQASLLELLTTNFVQMSSQSASNSLDTVYELSEFAKQYLDKHHPVAPDVRGALLSRSQELRDLGLQLSAATSATPFSAETVNVRTAGDVHVARLLRDALRQAETDPAAALALCKEAQVLSPSYYEAWRVEAQVKSMSRDDAGAVAAFDRALELAPDSAVLLCHYGTFLVNEAGEPERGRTMLQAAARSQPDAPEITAQISWAHYCLGDFVEAIEACRHMLQLKAANQQQLRGAAVVALRAAAHGAAAWIEGGVAPQAVELLELGLELAESARVENIVEEALDRLVQLGDLCDVVAAEGDDYQARKAKEFRGRFDDRVHAISAGQPTERRAGNLVALKTDKGFGFVTSDGTDFFVHYRDLADPADWERLEEGVCCVFSPTQTPKGPRARHLRVLI
jgi:Tfp pilus assembly protein PilF/cold shock CspA family protein